MANYVTLKQYRLQRFNCECYYHLIGLHHNASAYEVQLRISKLKFVINCSNGHKDPDIVIQWTDMNQIEQILTRKSKRREYNQLIKGNCNCTCNSNNDFLVKNFVNL